MMSDLWRCNLVNVRLTLDVLERLLGRGPGGPFVSLGSIPTSGRARILLWTSPRPPAEPAIVGMVVVRAGSPGTDAPTIRELHWPRTSNPLVLWRALER